VLIDLVKRSKQSRMRGHKQAEASTLAQALGHFGHCAGIVVDVFEDVLTHHEITSTGAEGGKRGGPRHSLGRDRYARVRPETRLEDACTTRIWFKKEEFARVAVQQALAEGPDSRTNLNDAP
jgi:hypothetical protein